MLDCYLSLIFPKRRWNHSPLEAARLEELLNGSDFSIEMLKEFSEADALEILLLNFKVDDVEAREYLVQLLSPPPVYNHPTLIF